MWMTLRCRWPVLAAMLCLALAGWQEPASAQDPLASVNEQLRTVLERHADAKKQIAITFTNKGYMDYVLNWLSYVEELGVDNYLIFALDSEAHQGLEQRGAHVFYDASLDKGKIDRAATDFGTDSFKKIVHLKPTLTLRVLELGFSLLLSDADVIWFQDPFQVEEVVGSPLNLMSDAHFGYSMGGTETFVNSGFAYMAPEPGTISFMREVVRLLASRPDKMDQDAYNTAISNWKRRTTEPLVYSVMDPARISCGWVYFMRRLGQREVRDLIAVHNNWADGGHDGNVHAIKLFRFREHLLWRSDPDERYTEDRLYLSYEHGGQGRVSVWEELEALRTGLAMAQVLGRALILPEFLCGGEPEAHAEGEQLRCTADSFIDVQALLAAFPDVRESSFIENDRVPLERVRPASHVLIMSGKEMTRLSGEGNDVLGQLTGSNLVLTTEDDDGVAQEHELLGLKNQVEHVPLLVVKDIAGKFRGHQHPVSQLYQDKALRKGVAPNHYVVEGAKRIHIKHVPAHCPGIHIPQWCLEDAEGCLARLPHLLSTGDARGMSRECLFVVRLDAERSRAAVQRTVDTLQTVFRKVWMVAEGMLEFPLSDLWRMGDHYMVTLMQQRLMSHLWAYVAVLPHKDAPLERFDAEVLRQRSEDMGKGLVQLTLDDGLARLLPSPKVACPCPAYPDNKMLKDVGHEMQHTLHRLRLAAVCFGEAAERNPADAEAWNWLANAQLNLEEYDAAFKAFAAANSLQPSASLLINMGVALQRSGRNQEAVDAYGKGLALDAAWPEAHLNRAYALQDLGRYQEAADGFAQALKLRPNWSRAHAGLASILSAAGQVQQAEEHLRVAIREDPYDMQQRLDLGQVLHARGAFEEEQKVYRDLVAELGDNAHAYSYWATSLLAAYQVSIGYRSYGKVPEDQLYIDQATQLYEKALAVDPRCGMCHGQFGDMYKDAHKVSKSVEHYTLSAQLLPHVPSVFCNLIYTKLFACEWSNYDADFERLMALSHAETDPAKGVPRYLCVQPMQAILYRPFSAALMKRVSITYTRKVLSEAGTIERIRLPAALRLPANDRRLRVGYVSADFKDHPVAKRMQDVYALHDRARVRVTCYCLNANDKSSWRIKIEAGVERFLDLHVMLAQQGPQGVATKIATDEADVLINLMGHTRGSDPLTIIMAHRPAPVQLMHEGYAGTMGGASHTAHVTDRYSSPPDYAPHYVEKLLYMPHAFFVNDHRQTYAELQQDVAVEGDEKASRLAFGSLPPDIAFIFGAFNQLYKVEPGIWDTWMDVMRQVPAAHLWMIRIHTRDPEYNLKARAAALGIAGERIHVVQGYNEKQHLYVKAAADVFLDTPSYNAHSSGCDVLWSGTPLLTVPGEKMGSRVAASLTAALNCHNTIARNEDDYAEIAIAFGLRPRALRRAKACVRKGKLDAPLFDTALWVRDQERALRMSSDVAFAYPSPSGEPGTRDFHIVTSPINTRPNS